MHRFTIIAACILLLGIVHNSAGYNNGYRCLKHCSYKFLGCFRDKRKMRILSQKASILKPNSPHLCQQFCAGFRYYGVSFGKGCFCGNKLRKTVRVKNGCKKACTENTLLTCGDVNELQVYVLERHHSGV